MTKSRDLESMCRRVVQASDDWDFSLPEHIIPSMWLHANDPLLTSIFYHMIGHVSHSWLVETYRKVPFSDHLLKEDGPPSVLPLGQVTEAQVVMKSPSGKVVSFNPQEHVEP